ncbi:MAG: DUF5996 family protein [Microvirga sp.]
MRDASWPELSYPAWRDTAATLQLWTQIVGKIRLSLSPWLNHGWQVPLYVSARGLGTSPIPIGHEILEIEFDFLSHLLRVRTSSGEERELPLQPQSVADFYSRILTVLNDIGVEVAINEMPNEVADPIRFSEDRVHASYDRHAAHRFWRVLVQVDRVFKLFRSGFLGKSSPVHFFWGSFDLAVSRFSGRRAPPMPKADRVTQEGYSHEVASVGWWPGDAATPYAAFYAYAAPEPEGFSDAKVRPAAAFYDRDASQFRLKYDDVRAAASPRQAVLDFCQSTYEAAATLGKWNRAELER